MNIKRPLTKELKLLRDRGTDRVTVVVFDYNMHPTEIPLSLQNTGRISSSRVFNAKGQLASWVLKGIDTNAFDYRILFNV